MALLLRSTLPYILGHTETKKEPENDKFITLSEDQLTKLIGLVTQQPAAPPAQLTPTQIPPTQPVAPIAVPEPEVKKSVELTTSDLDASQALNMLQGGITSNTTKSTVTPLTRDEQLKQSQKLIPLQMRSSFLPSEAVPRDVLAEQRKEKQMEWRRELEKQRREDELRKKEQKQKEKRESMPDHHLFQSGKHVTLFY